MKRTTSTLLALVTGAMLTGGILCGDSLPAAAMPTDARVQARLHTRIKAPRHHHHHRRPWRHRHHRHRHHSPSLLFLWYDDDWYGYYPRTYVVPGEHRRLPAFRMPGFFHYPGALGKGEKISEIPPADPPR